MSRKEIPRLVARRTPEIEALLQEIWRLRPDLADKSKLTIFLSLDALAREAKGTVRWSSGASEKNDATEAPAAAQMSVSTEKKEQSVGEPISPKEEINISDDVEWD